MQHGETLGAHSRHVTLHHTVHLVRNSSQPYMVMLITLVVDVKHCRKIRGSPAAPETKLEVYALMRSN